MQSILSALLGVPFGMVAAAVWNGLRRKPAAEPREAHLLEAVRSFVGASRVSSAAVIETLALTLRAADPAIDAILVFVPDGEDLACAYSCGDRAVHYSSLRLRRDAAEHLPSRAAQAGHRVAAAFGAGVLIPTDRRALAVPIVDDARLRAVVYVSSPDPEALRHEDVAVRTIEHAAAPYAFAVEREADRADATYDALTGLLTPRVFRARLHEELARVRSAPQGALTLWFIDTDRFKTVNDTHGHASGDIVLQRMADLLRLYTVPEVDVVGRNGGDEFCAMIYGAQKTVAIERAQRFCDAVRTHDFGIETRITASVGVATYPFDAQTSSELLEVADAAMYHSKREGRDRVSFAVEPAEFLVYR